jgi:hypothetical protein
LAFILACQSDTLLGWFATPLWRTGWNGSALQMHKCDHLSVGMRPFAKRLAHEEGTVKASYRRILLTATLLPCLRAHRS